MKNTERNNTLAAISATYRAAANNDTEALTAARDILVQRKAYHEAQIKLANASIKEMAAHLPEAVRAAKAERTVERSTIKDINDALAGTQ